MKNYITPKTNFVWQSTKTPLYGCLGLSLSDRLDLSATTWVLNFILECLLASTNPRYTVHPDKVEHTVFLWVLIDGYRAIIKRLLMILHLHVSFRPVPEHTGLCPAVFRHVAGRVLNSVGYSQPALNSTDTLSVQMDGSRDLSVIF